MAEMSNQMLGLGVLALLVIVALCIFKPKPTTIMNCVPVVGNRLRKGVSDGNEGLANVDYEPEYGPGNWDYRSYFDDPYFESNKLKPQQADEDSPDWVKNFTEGNDKLLQQNFIDTSNIEKFQVTKSVCGRRFMSRDLRRTPTVTTDPTTVNSFQLPTIDPVCAKEYNEIRPPLDCF